MVLFFVVGFLKSCDGLDVQVGMLILYFFNILLSCQYLVFMG